MVSPIHTAIVLKISWFHKGDHLLPDGLPDHLPLVLLLLVLLPPLLLCLLDCFLPEPLLFRLLFLAVSAVIISPSSNTRNWLKLAQVRIKMFQAQAQLVCQLFLIIIYSSAIQELVWTFLAMIFFDNSPANFQKDSSSSASSSSSILAWTINLNKTWL